MRERLRVRLNYPRPIVKRLYCFSEAGHFKMLLAVAIAIWFLSTSQNVAGQFDGGKLFRNDTEPAFTLQITPDTLTLIINDTATLYFQSRYCYQIPFNVSIVSTITWSIDQNILIGKWGTAKLKTNETLVIWDHFYNSQVFIFTKPISMILSDGIVAR